MNIQLGTQLFVEPLMGTNPEDGIWVDVISFNEDRPVVAQSGQKNAIQFEINPETNRLMVGYQQRVFESVEAYQAHLNHLELLRIQNQMLNEAV